MGRKQWSLKTIISTVAESVMREIEYEPLTECEVTVRKELT